MIWDTAAARSGRIGLQATKAILSVFGGATIMPVIPGDTRDFAAFELLPDGVVVAGSDQRVTAINAVAASILRTDAAEALGSHLGDVLALEDLHGSDWWSYAKPYDGLASRSLLLERAWFLADGTEVLVTAKLNRSRPRAPVESVVVSLRDARARARADRERSDLVATVAHELRSPLTGVKGFTATLLAKWERFSESQRLLMLQTVEADADRLSRLIAELLDVARIDSGRLQLLRQPFDLVAAVTHIANRLDPADGRVIKIDADQLPETWVDPDKFDQVMSNLIENALRHGDGPVSVTLRALPDAVEIEVLDQGQGIDASARSRIFTKFWRTGNASGTGLGLFIVKGLVEAHGGTVRVAESTDAGARMFVTFPAGEPDD
jgi:signal transduction histidine kinase